MQVLKHGRMHGIYAWTVEFSPAKVFAPSSTVEIWIPLVQVAAPTHLCNRDNVPHESQAEISSKIKIIRARLLKGKFSPQIKHSCLPDIGIY